MNCSVLTAGACGRSQGSFNGQRGYSSFFGARSIFGRLNDVKGRCGGAAMTMRNVSGKWLGGLMWCNIYQLHINSTF